MPAAGTLARVLAGQQQQLLVLDNCEHAAVIRALSIGSPNQRQRRSGLPCRCKAAPGLAACCEVGTGRPEHVRGAGPASREVGSGNVSGTARR